MSMLAGPLAARA